MNSRVFDLPILMQYAIWNFEVLLFVEKFCVIIKYIYHIKTNTFLVLAKFQNLKITYDFCDIFKILSKN